MSIQTRIASVTRKPAAANTDDVGNGSRRWANRKASGSNGQILFDGITTPYVCIVRDISSTGARVEMVKNKFNPDAATAFIPTQFSLIMPLDRTRVDCQSMWRRGSFIGIKFLGHITALPTPAKRAPISLGKRK